MKCKDSSIYTYIDRELKLAIHKNWESLTREEVVNAKVKVHNWVMRENRWIESLPIGEIYIIELSEKKLFLKNVYSKGLLLKNKEVSVLTQEQLWDLGI